MTLWWIGNALLLLVILPVVVYLLKGVLDATRSIVPSVDRIAAAAKAGSSDLDAAALLLDDAGPGQADGRGGCGLRRLARRDRRRRGGGVAMPAAGVVLIIAVVLIVLALVYFLVSTIFALRRITAGLDEAIAGVGEIIEKSAPVGDVVTDINRNLDAGVGLLEGLLVKKAGLVDAVGLVDGLYPGAAAAGLRNFPDSKTVTPPRIAEVYTKGTLTLARLGREAPIAAASPSGPVLRNVEGGSLDARSLYPEVRQTRPESLPRSPVIGTGAPVQYPPSEQRGGTTPDGEELREKGPWAETAAEGIVPAELGGSDAPREKLAEDPGARQPGPRGDDRIRRAGDRERHRPEWRRRGRRDLRRRAGAAGGSGARLQGRDPRAPPGRRRFG